MDKIKKQVEEEIKKISEEGVNVENTNYLGKLVDICKDYEEINYYKVKEEKYENEKKLRRLRKL